MSCSSLCERGKEFSSTAWRGATGAAGAASVVKPLLQVPAVLHSNKTLPDNHIYVEQGHHSHRLPIKRWACPFTPGVNCSTDDWMDLYAEHIMTHLTPDLPQLAGMTLVCDCPMTIPCEADVLAGFVFEQTRPHEKPHPQALGVTRRRGAGQRQVMVAAALASQVMPVRSIVPAFSQESVCQAVCKLFPDGVFDGFQFPMVEDLINADTFLTYSRWLSEFRASTQQPTPFEQVPVTFAAYVTFTYRGQLHSLRKDIVGRLKELHRRWKPVSSRLRQFQTAEIRCVTSRRDLGFLALLVVLKAWGDTSLPKNFLPADLSLGKSVPRETN